MMTDATHVVTALNLATDEVMELYFDDVFEAQEQHEYLTYVGGYADVTLKPTGMLAHKSQLLHDSYM